MGTFSCLQASHTSLKSPVNATEAKQVFIDVKSRYCVHTKQKRGHTQQKCEGLTAATNNDQESALVLLMCAC